MHGAYLQLLLRHGKRLPRQDLPCSIYRECRRCGLYYIRLTPIICPVIAGGWRTYKKEIKIGKGSERERLTESEIHARSVTLLLQAAKRHSQYIFNIFYAHILPSSRSTSFVLICIYTGGSRRIVSASCGSTRRETR